MRTARDPVVLALTACEKTSGSWWGGLSRVAVGTENARAKPRHRTRATAIEALVVLARCQAARATGFGQTTPKQAMADRERARRRGLVQAAPVAAAALARAQRREIGRSRAPPRARRAHRALTRRERRAAARARMSICDLRLCAVRSRAVAAVVWVVGGRGAEHGGLGRQSTARRRGVHVHFTMKTPGRCTR